MLSVPAGGGRKCQKLLASQPFFGRLEVRLLTGLSGVSSAVIEGGTCGG